MLRHRLLGEQGHRRSRSRGLRHRSRRPALEGLEPRVVLSQLVSVGGTTYELAINGSANEVLKSNGSSWTPITGTSTSVSQIAGTGSGLFMLANNGGLSASNQVWEYTGSGSNWSTVTGTNTSVSQIAGDGDGLFMLANNGSANQVWEYAGSGSNWSTVSGTNTSVSQIAGNGSGVFMLANNGGANQVWEYTGSGSNWSTVTGTSTSVSQIDGAGAGLFMLANNGGVNQVWEYTGSGSNWTAVTGTSTHISQLVSTGSSLFMLANNGGVNQVWEYAGSGSNWSTVTGTNTSVSQIADSGAELFMLASNGGVNQVWEYTGSGSNWASLITDPTSVTGNSPAPASAPLYNSNGPSYLDVEQGQVGDCWLLASLAEVAARAPQDIENMFVYDGTTVDNGSTVGVYSVRLFSTTGTAFDVEVDTDLPSAGEYYDHVANDLGTQALWVALAEKAYAEANVLGLVTTHFAGQDSYSALNNGDPATALQAITGKPASDYAINPTNIATAWNSGELIAMCTTTPPSSLIVGSHCYAVVGYNASSGQPFQVFNPWGTDSSGWAPGESNTIYGLFTATAAFISQNFASQSIGTGAIDVNNVTEPFNALTGSATLGDGYATSATIKITGHNASGSVVYPETATGYTRPAQGTAIGTDPGDSSDSSDDDHMTARDTNGPVGPMVVISTGPTFTRPRSYNRKFWMSS
jgi:hypothetical protein